MWFHVDLLLNIVHFTGSQRHFWNLRLTLWFSNMMTMQWHKLVSIDASYIVLGFVWNIIKISDISSKTGNFCYILYGLFQNFGKSKFVLRLKWTNLVDPALKYQLCGHVLLWILFMNGVQLCQIFLRLHMEIKTCAFYQSKLRILSAGLVIFMAEWSC